MGGENENESKFGFKDKEKAEETLKLLEEHDMQYRKLTVRGLLGRAKRVLTMTKAEEKIKNINEAIDVFDKWLEENGGGAANKNSKTDNNDKADTVPGLGFKDKESAEKTLKILEGRDPDYQKLAVKGLIGSSKRVLSGTKNEEKIKSIKEGVQILEDFLERFDRDNLIRYNKAYLSYSIIEKLPQPNDNNDNDKLAKEFLQNYGGNKAKGNYKHLRTMYPIDDDSTSWDIIRNNKLHILCDQMQKDNLKLFTDNGIPTEFHLKLIHWAYSPQSDKLKLYTAEKSSEAITKKAEKRKSNTNSDDDDDDDDSSNMSDDDDDNHKISPAKKQKVY